MTEKRAVLVVEDEHAISNFICRALSANDYKPIPATSGKEGLSLFFSHSPDLVLLDLGLPDMDGLEFIRSARETSEVPIIVLSARTSERDKVEALDMGANDYITKPFNPVEMTARVKAQLRRYTQYNSRRLDDSVIDFQGLILNKNTHECSLYGEKLNLTPTEFAILQMLCENRGKVISSQELFESIWKEKYFESNNTVMVHIRRIREKMHEQPRNPKFIKTVWGMGYKIEK